MKNPISFGTSGWRAHREEFTDNGGNGYALRIQAGSDMIIKRIDDGSNNNVVSDSTVSPPTDEWLRQYCEWHSNGKIVYTLYRSDGTEIGTIEGKDTNYQSGNIFGWRVNTGGDEVGYADYAIKIGEL